jgi:Cu+-exporting ATPase
MGGGVDAASEVADVVLLGDRLPAVLETLSLGRATLATIRQNIGWACAYNAVCLPLAAGAALPGLGLVLTPSLSGALMGASSLAVMANSLALRWRCGRGDPARWARAPEAPRAGLHELLGREEEGGGAEEAKGGGAEAAKGGGAPAAV